MTSVLALDPGGTTGWALATRLAGTSEGWAFSSGQIGGGFDGAMTFLAPEGKVPWFDVTEVVIESFIINQATHKKDLTAAYEALDIIGGVRQICRWRQLRLVRQTPAQGKTFGTDEKLRRLGWYTPTEGGHANDAARHLITHLVGTLRDRDLATRLLQGAP